MPGIWRDIWAVGASRYICTGPSHERAMWFSRALGLKGGTDFCSQDGRSVKGCETFQWTALGSSELSVTESV